MASHIRALEPCSLLLLVSCTWSLQPCRGEEANKIPADTLQHKVMCGYQGWFRCPGDGTQDGWLHWSRSRNRITPESLTIEMWPDMSEYDKSERFSVPGFTGSDNEPAELFSSAQAQTVDRHFRWMQEYGIDGVFLQRFLVNLGRPSFDDVLHHARAAAKKSGRIYAICYDLSGAPQDRLYELLVNDWQKLVNETQITQDDRYLHHHGKPVLFVWGFFDDRFDAAVGHRIIDFLKNDKKYATTLVGGCQWYWRSTTDPEWAKAFRRFDIISPWNVGHYKLDNGLKVADIDPWQDDLAEADRADMEYLPVIYPGFGWTNLKGPAAERATIPRRGGAFFWEQFHHASELGIEMAYVAMFDEVDEATAIFKVSNQPPTQVRFQTLENLPTDWYLRLTGEGSRVLRGDQAATPKLPIKISN